MYVHFFTTIELSTPTHKNSGMQIFKKIDSRLHPASEQRFIRYCSEKPIYNKHASLIRWNFKTPLEIQIFELKKSIISSNPERDLTVSEFNDL